MTTTTTTTTAATSRRATRNDATPIYGAVASQSFTDGAVNDSAEALRLGKMDFDVTKESVTNDANGRTVPDWYALTRSDNGDTMYMVGNEYKPFQYRDAFRLFDGLMQDGVIRYECAFTVQGGRQGIIAARLPSCDHDLPGGDSLQSLLFLRAVHGGGSVNVTPTAFRPWCANLTGLILADASARGTLHTVRHSGNIDAKMADVADYLRTLDVQFATHADNARTLAAKAYSPAEAKAYVESLYPTPDAKATSRTKTAHEHRLATLREAFRSPANTADGVRGTWWALANMVTEAIDHGQPLRQSRDHVARAENRFLNGLSGANADAKAEAMTVALAMAA